MAQVLPPRHLNELEVVFQAMFGLSLAMLQTRRDVDLSYLEAEAEERRHREGRDPEVPGRVIWLGLLRQEVTTLHIRLLMAFLGHRELAMVKRGYATRSGAREDYAWVEFTTLAEARRVRYRYDDIRFVLYINCINN